MFPPLLGYSSRIGVTVLLILCVVRGALASPIIDIIPNSMSAESGQNSEPSLAVDPLNTSKMVAMTFPPGGGPIFTTSDGGSTWSNFQGSIPISDATLGWGDVNAYQANVDPNQGNHALAVRTSSDATSVLFQNNPTGDFVDGTGTNDIPDQPSLTVNTVGGNDHVYMAFNDNHNAPATASVRLSTNSGATWTNEVLEQGTAFQQDAPSVRTAANGNRVYGAFLRLTSNSSGDYVGNIVVVRDDNSGADSFRDLGTQGSTVAAGVISGFTSSGSDVLLGQERMGNLSLAVDPNNANRVVVAYLDGTDSNPMITVQESNDGGLTWASVYHSPAQSVVGEVSITADGSVGVLYNHLTGGNWETHFTETGNNFATTADNVLSRFPDGTPAKQFDPYLGDFENVKSVGNTFYGVFTASNNDSNPTFSFPEGVTFQRDMRNGLPVNSSGASVAVSLDPYFFSFGGLSTPEPGSFPLAASGLVALLGFKGFRRRTHGDSQRGGPSAEEV